MYVVINEDLVPQEKATLHISDLSIQRGYGIFDFFKTVGGRPLFLDDHLDRFFHSAKLMRLPLNLSRDRLKELIFQLIDKNQIEDSGVRITLTGGNSPDGFSIGQPNLILTQTPLSIPSQLSGTGCKLITHEYQRQFHEAKTLDYLQAIWLQPILNEQKVNDVLYHRNGLVAECPRANFFLVTADGTVVTASTGILKGVIRRQIVEVIAKVYPVIERDIPVTELAEAKEAFITSTTKNVMPVTSIDGKVFGDGKPGPITSLIATELGKLLSSVG